MSLARCWGPSGPPATPLPNLCRWRSVLRGWPFLWRGLRSAQGWGPGLWALGRVGQAPSTPEAGVNTASAGQSSGPEARQSSRWRRLDQSRCLPRSGCLACGLELVDQRLPLQANGPGSGCPDRLSYPSPSPTKAALGRVWISQHLERQARETPFALSCMGLWDVAQTLPGSTVNLSSAPCQGLRAWCSPHWVLGQAFPWLDALSTQPAYGQKKAPPKAGALS